MVPGREPAEVLEGRRQRPHVDEALQPQSCGSPSPMSCAGMKRGDSALTEASLARHLHNCGQHGQDLCEQLHGSVAEQIPGLRGDDGLDDPQVHLDLVQRGPDLREFFVGFDAGLHQSTTYYSADA